jgi:hypothetical protein
MLLGVSLLVQHGRKLSYMSQLSEPYTYKFSGTKKVLQDSLALLDRLAAPLTIDNFGQSMGYGRHSDEANDDLEGGEQKEDEDTEGRARSCTSPPDLDVDYQAPQGEKNKTRGSGGKRRGSGEARRRGSGGQRKGNAGVNELSESLLQASELHSVPSGGSVNE